MEVCESVAYSFGVFDEVVDPFGGSVAQFACVPSADLVQPFFRVRPSDRTSVGLFLWVNDSIRL